jgi:16S rRNA G966 N2-methylase RsmD
LNKSILDKEVQEFISNNLETDIFQLILKKQLFTKVSNKEIAVQITSKFKSKKKLPNWFATTNIYFPNKINIEQTSSEQTAKFKSSLVKGENMIDCTGGFGIDSYYFSKSFNSVIYLEKDKSLFNITRLNSEKFGIKNTLHLNEDGIEYAKKSKKKFDLIYIDPSRRNETSKKVHFLNECDPVVDLNLIKQLDNFSTILIKCSPIIDIKKTIKDLIFVNEVFIVGIKNEVKEVLFKLYKFREFDINFRCVDLSNRKADFSFNYKEVNNKTDKSFSEIKKYLYEPNSMILKSGAFNLVSKRFNLNKLNPNTHLYTSDKLIDFPGRIFKVIKTVNYTTKNLKELNFKNANISTRNFPLEVKNIRKINKINDGGNDYLFFTTNNLEELIVIQTNKVNSTI